MLGVFFRGISTSSWLGIRITPPISAAPLKRKAKVDPAILRAKEDKKRRRLSKALRKMERQSRILRPIEELEEPELQKEKFYRKELGAEEVESRDLALKDWNRYCSKRDYEDSENLKRILESRERALLELRSVSESLYAASLCEDPLLTGMSWTGPPLTLPLGDEYIVDGRYSDVTKEFKIHYEDMKAFMEQLIVKKRLRKKKDEEEDED